MSSGLMGIGDGWSVVEGECIGGGGWWRTLCCVSLLREWKKRVGVAGQERVDVHNSSAD